MTSGTHRLLAFAARSLVILLAGAACAPADPSISSEYPYARADQDVCSPRPVDQAGVEVVERDSAGIRIVENWVPATPLSIVRPELVTTISPDPNDGANLSGRIAGAIRRGDGAVIVADSMTGSVALYDSTGRFVRLMGRSGDGPGEFHRIYKLVRIAGDTLGVIDIPFGRRLTRILDDGTYVDASLIPAHMFDRPIGNMLGAPRWILGVFRDGSVVAFHRLGGPIYPIPPGSTASHQDTMELSRIEPAAGTVRLVGRLADREYFRFEGSGPRGISWYQPRPFGILERFAVSGEEFSHSSGPRFEAIRLQKDGQIRQVVRVCLGPVLVTAAMRERWKEGFLHRLYDQKLRPEAATFLELLPFPEMGAPFANLMADRDGWLWLGEYWLDGDPQLWRVADPKGTVRAAVEVPAGVRLVEVGAEHLVGIKTDEDDLPTVLIYRWQRPVP